LVDQPSGIRSTWHFQLHAGGTERGYVHHAGTRDFKRRIVYAGGNSLRTPAYLRDLGIRRLGDAYAYLREIFPVYCSRVGRVAIAEWIRWRIPGAERRVPGKDVVGRGRSDWRDL